MDNQNQKSGQQGQGDKKNQGGQQGQQGVRSRAVHSRAVSRTKASRAATTASVLRLTVRYTGDFSKNRVRVFGPDEGFG
jgi:hypothetical protein